MLSIMKFHAALSLIAIVTASTRYDDHYIGSVVEYHRVWDDEKSSEDNIYFNAERYLDFIREASSKKADIIVFPEIGLQSINTNVFIPIPDPKENVIPWRDGGHHFVIRMLSEAADMYKIYVVVNILENYTSDDKEHKYNTNVAFDREGRVVARYRKLHLYAESRHETTEVPEYSYFDTDFGVRFGLFTCFDILFSQPSLQLINEFQVSDFAFTTAWMSQLPFLTAIQTQASWSYGSGANLLAAGLNDMAMGHSGSGIYAGSDGPLVYKLMETDESHLLLATVKKKDKLPQMSIKKVTELATKADKIPFPKPNEDRSRLRISSEELKIYTSFMLDPQYEYEKDSKVDRAKGSKTNLYVQETTVCHKKFCCEFSLNFSMVFGPKEEAPPRDSAKGDEADLFRYRLAALDGVKSFGGESTAGVQICALVPCLNTELSTCGVRADQQKVRTRAFRTRDDELGVLELKRTSFWEVKIKGHFDKEDAFISPNVLLVNGDGTMFGKVPHSRQMSLSVDQSDIALLQLKTEENRPIRLITASLHSRLFSRDGQPLLEIPQNTNTIAFYMLALLAITAIFVGWPYLIRVFYP